MGKVIFEDTLSNWQVDLIQIVKGNYWCTVYFDLDNYKDFLRVLQNKIYGSNTISFSNNVVSYTLVDIYAFNHTVIECKLFFSISCKKIDEKVSV